MRRSLLKYSAWISLLLITATSCRSVMVSHPGEQAEKMRESFVSGSFEKISCKAKVTFHGTEISGLMMIKNTGGGNYKLAFYNELGITYLEGLFEKSSKHEKLVVNNTAPALNHRAFVKSFEKAIQELFSNKNPQPVKSPNRQIAKSSNRPITQSSNLLILLPNGFSLELDPDNIHE